MTRGDLNYSLRFRLEEPHRSDEAMLKELYRRIQSGGIEDPPITWQDVQQWGSIVEPPIAEECALFDPHMVNIDEPAFAES